MHNLAEIVTVFGADSCCDWSSTALRVWLQCRSSALVCDLERPTVVGLCVAIGVSQFESQRANVLGISSIFAIGTKLRLRVV